MLGLPGNSGGGWEVREALYIILMFRYACKCFCFTQSFSVLCFEGLVIVQIGIVGFLDLTSLLYI